MPTGTISSPSSWKIGTPFPPAWATDVQDNINAWVAGTVALTGLTGTFLTNTSGTTTNAGGGIGVLGKDSVPWAWGRISVSAGVSCTLVRGNNLGDPNYVSTGQYDVVLTNAVSSTSQAVVLVSVAGGSARCVSYTWQTTSIVRIFAFDAAGVAAEVTDFSVIVYST